MKATARSALLGLDVGTTALKGVLFDLSGETLASTERTYALQAPHPGWVEQRPDEVWAALLETLRELTQQADEGRRILALALGRRWGVPAYVVDPVVTDELMDRARLTGLPGLERRSIFHALNQRGVARIAAERLGVEYRRSNFIVCHMGGGVSIGAHRRGRVVDVINALDGEGPFTPERTGSLPLVPILDMVHEGKRDYGELRTTILRQGGLVAHLGTNDPREVLARMEQGDEHAGLVFRAMAYGIARHIVSMAPALTLDEGGLDLAAVVLTGGLSRCRALVEDIARQVSFLGPVEVVPGEVEMSALAAGAASALSGREPVRAYRAD